MNEEKMIAEYKQFMYDEANIHNCDECPENRGYDDFQNRKPCGQWHCWVIAHCEA